jgi:hypothetical protein
LKKSGFPLIVKGMFQALTYLAHIACMVRRFCLTHGQLG